VLSAFQGPDGIVTRVLVADSESGRPRRVPGLHLGKSDGAGPWTPDGRAIVLSHWPNAGVELYDVRTGRRQPLLVGPATPVSFAPDGKSYVFDWQDGIWLGDTTTGATRRIIARGGAPAWSPDGRRLAFVSDRDHNGEVGIHESPSVTAREVYVADADGTHQRRLTHTTDDEYGPLVWTQDSAALLYTRLNPRYIAVRAVDLARNCNAHVASFVLRRRALDDVAWDYWGSAADLHLAC
jgi:Tol biopolymer transport system component